MIEDREDQASEDAAERLQQRLGSPPELAMVLGSGLAGVQDHLEGATTASFDELGLPAPRVPGHRTIAACGELGGRRVIVLAGRVHLYEGHDPRTVVRYVRALHAWGVPRLLPTCAVGGLAEGLDAGDLVLVSDHINLMGRTPLLGRGFGERFPDLAGAYDPAMRAHLASVAASLGVAVREGVLAAMLGPSYETPAESRMLAQLGADVVSMSTVPEVTAARALGMRCAVVAAVANRAPGMGGGPVAHEDVVAAVQAAAGNLARLLTAALPGMP